MRLIKMLGLAAVAAMAAMAFVGATSASAANTQLCNSHEALTCGEGQAAATVSIIDVIVGVLLTSTLNIECDTITGSGTPLALASPQQIHVSGLSFESCEASPGEDVCTVTVTQQPLATLNKTGLNAGTLTLTSGKTFVICEDTVFSVDIECEYDLTGLTFTVGSQVLVASEAPVSEIGEGLCPGEPGENTTLDGLLSTTGGNRYILA
jgi:hypothetical protein